MAAEGRQGAAGAGTAGPQQERGVGDWQQYQPPSAVLASIAARGAGSARPSGPPGPPRRPPGPPRLPPGPPPSSRLPPPPATQTAGQQLPLPPSQAAAPPHIVAPAQPGQHAAPQHASAAGPVSPAADAAAPTSAAATPHTVSSPAADVGGDAGGGTPRAGGELRPPRPSYFSKPVLHAQPAEPAAEQPAQPGQGPHMFCRAAKVMTACAAVYCTCFHQIGDVPVLCRCLS